MQDAFGRTSDYLRISLTDRCNLRCTYCLPENACFKPLTELMTDDELLTLFGLFVDLVRAMIQIPGVGDITMTTNGLRLAEFSHPPADAGLRRCNTALAYPEKSVGKSTLANTASS